MMNPVPAEALSLDLVRNAIVAACHEANQTSMSNDTNHDSGINYSPITFRLGAPSDMPAVAALLKKNADQRQSHEDNCLPRDFDLVHWIIIEESNNVVGFATVYWGYSTWDGRCLHANRMCARDEETEADLLRILANVAVRLEGQRLVWQVCVVSASSQQVATENTRMLS